MVSNKSELEEYIQSIAEKHEIDEEDISPFIQKLTQGGYKKRAHLKLIGDERLKEYAGIAVIEDAIKYELNQNANSKPAAKSTYAKSIPAFAGQPQEEVEHANILYVKIYTGKTLTYRLVNFSSETIKEIKELIEGSEGIPPCEQKLMFAGRFLEDERTLQDYNIKTQSTLYLLLQLGGC